MSDVSQDELEKLIDARARAIVTEREAAKAGAERDEKRVKRIAELAIEVAFRQRQIATFGSAADTVLRVVTAVFLFLISSTIVAGALIDHFDALNWVMISGILLVLLLVSSLVASLGWGRFWRNKLVVVRSELASAERELRDLKGHEPGDARPEPFR